MIKFIIVLMISMLATPIFAGSHCYVRKSHCYVKPTPIKIIEIKLPAQKIEQTVQNNIQVTNNLIMSPPLAPLVIQPPFPNPEYLQRRLFSFRNNMPDPQIAKQQIRSAFTGLANNQAMSPFIMNNVVNRTITTSTKSGVTTTTSIVKAVPIQSEPNLTEPLISPDPKPILLKPEITQPEDPFRSDPPPVPKLIPKSGY